MVEHELLEAERHVALYEAFTRLPHSCQQLIALLIEDPPVPYGQISRPLHPGREYRANPAPAENLIHAGGSRCMGEADVVRDGGRWGARATGNAVAW